MTYRKPPPAGRQALGLLIIVGFFGAIGLVGQLPHLFPTDAAEARRIERRPSVDVEPSRAPSETRGPEPQLLVTPGPLVQEKAPATDLPKREFAEPTIPIERLQEQLRILRELEPDPDAWVPVGSGSPRLFSLQSDALEPLTEIYRCLDSAQKDEREGRIWSPERRRAYSDCVAEILVSPVFAEPVASFKPGGAAVGVRSRARACALSGEPDLMLKLAVDRALEVGLESLDHNAAHQVLELFTGRYLAASLAGAPDGEGLDIVAADSGVDRRDLIRALALATASAPWNMITTGVAVDLLDGEPSVQDLPAELLDRLWIRLVGDVHSVLEGADAFSAGQRQTVVVLGFPTSPLGRYDMELLEQLLNEALALDALRKPEPWQRPYLNSFLALAEQIADEAGIGAEGLERAETLRRRALDW